jgi:diguanylate cyclase (GGDEF)-like protein/PAS domain S-box-containing protein
MRQTLLLNIAIFGFFVLLFYSLYRGNPLNRLKFWIGGWVWIFVHFLLLLLAPRTGLLMRAEQSFAMAALLLCGVWFLISVPVRSARARNVAACVLSLLCTLFCFQLSGDRPIWSGGFRGWSMLFVGLLLQATALLALWSYRGAGLKDVDRRGSAFRASVTIVILGFAGWGCYALLHADHDAALSTLLTEMFLSYALLYCLDCVAFTVGALTTVIGLVGWAAVFPLALFVGAHWPHLEVQPEIWDLPKVFVAFGMLVTLLEDERGRSEREREQYQALFDGNPLAMWIYDPVSTRLTEANRAAARDFGWSRDELQTLTLQNLIADTEASPSALHTLNSRLSQTTVEEGSARALRQQPNEVARADGIRLRTRDGREVIADATVQKIRFCNREARLLIVEDMTAQTEAHQQLVHMANHDPLTGLPNRLLLEDRMRSALANAARHGRKVAILCMDLDRFKHINDNFGHAAGDSCLREVAARLLQRLRATDTAARTGGEEFMIVLDDIGNLEDAERVADDVLACFRLPHLFDGLELRMSASLGIALFPDDGHEPSALWSMADAAMYRAKKGGGNRHTFFSRPA